MFDSVKKAQEIITTFEEDHDVIELRPLPFLHTTLNYFCCHTPEVVLCCNQVLHRGVAACAVID